MAKATRIYMSCQDQTHKRHWHVTQRRGNRSAFNGYHWTPSDYSRVRCPIDGLTWRTKAAYVDGLPDAPEKWWEHQTDVCPQCGAIRTVRPDGSRSYAYPNEDRERVLICRERGHHGWPNIPPIFAERHD